jgi:hypothetical protein
MTRSVSHPVIPVQAWNPVFHRLFWIPSLRGNDGDFDRLVLKKARVVHESMAQYHKLRSIDS